MAYPTPLYKDIRDWLGQIDAYEMCPADCAALVEIVANFASHHDLALTDHERIAIIRKRIESL